MQAGHPEVVSSERAKIRVPTVSGEPEGKIAAREMTRVRSELCGVDRPQDAWKLHAREPRDPVVVRKREGADRWGKAMSSNPHAHDGPGVTQRRSTNEARERGRGGP